MPAPNLSLLIARIPPKLMLVVVSSLALTAGLLVHKQQEQSAEIVRKITEKNNIKETCSVLLAAREIPEGTTISSEFLCLENIEKSRIPFGALQNESAALGLEARMTIHKGDSILSQALSLPKRATGFEAKIKPGLRAITFPVDASTGVAGFLTPDCRVDILAQTGSGVEAKAVPILSDVQVVAVGQTYKDANGEAQQASSVTVAVTPRDGGRLVNAMAQGRLYCLMRNKMDRVPLAVKDISSTLARPANASDATELSSLPLSIPQLPPAVPEEKSTLSQSSFKNLHNIQTWAASKKDEVSFSK